MLGHVGIARLRGSSREEWEGLDAQSRGEGPDAKSWGCDMQLGKLKAWSSRKG